MFKHIVMWKFKNEVTNSDQMKMVKILKELKSKIPKIIDLDVGLNISQNISSYDIILITMFESESDYKVYSSDPNHLEVVDFIKSVVDDKAVVDYTL